MEDKQAKAIERSAAIRSRSGSVDSSDPLVAFFYTLMRNHVTPGVIEEMMIDGLDEPREVQYSNGWLASYAIDLVNRFRREAV